MEKLSFHWADYLVFALSLLTSLAIGIYFGYTDRKDATTENFLMGNRRLFFLPVAFSFSVSIMNAIAIIGIPAEVFYFGPVTSLHIVCPIPVGIFLCLVVIPVLHKLKLTSAYEYFDKRYKFPPLRIAMSLVFIMFIVLFLAVVLYAPALAINEVTGLSMVASILSSGVVTIYTAVGGMKAVVWADTLQVTIMFVGQLLLLVMGMYNEGVGGPGEMFEKARQGNRLDFGVWDTDPRTRTTVWTQVIGQSITLICMFCTSQMTLQRIMTVRTMRQAQYVAAIFTLCWCVLSAIPLFMAWVMYAYYFDCHPLKAGTISKASQLVPRFLVDIMGHLHGLPGLFTAAVFAAALSSVSSALNSLAAVILEDFIKPIYRRTKKDMSDRTAFHISKAIAICFGILTVALSFAADYVAGDHLFEIIVTVWSTFTSPVMGAFLLSFFVPWMTGLGCLIGMLVSLVTTTWMGVGGVFYGRHRAPLQPLGMCLEDGNATITTTLSLPETTSIPWTALPEADNIGDTLQYCYDISYNWYALIGLVISMVVGATVSLLTLCCKKMLSREMMPADRELMFHCSKIYVRIRYMMKANTNTMKAKMLGIHSWILIIASWTFAENQPCKMKTRD